MTTLKDILMIPGTRAFDIDDVMIPLKDYIVIAINDYFGDRLIRPFRSSDYVWMGLEQSLLLAESGVTKEEKLRMFKYMEHSKMIENIMLQFYCAASMNILSKTGENVLVTSRANGYFDNPVEMTYRWLDNVEQKNRKFIKPKVIFDHNKVEPIRAHNMVMGFEDNPAYALPILQDGVPIVLFNQSWNMIGHKDKEIITKEAYEEKIYTIKKIEPYNNKLLFRVNGWYDIFRSLIN